MRGGEVRVAGHFGEFVQGRIGPGGPLALITIPCPVLSVSARHLPGPGLSLHGAGQRLLSPARARALLDHLGLNLSGRVTFSAGMPAGGGAGASTATLLALARLARADGRPEALARACLAVEGASDPLMFEAPERLLWASREGRILDRMPAIPKLDVLGGFFGPHRRTEPRDMAFPDIADLIEPWRMAAASGDGAALASVASTSACRSLSMRGPGEDPTERLAETLGAMGFAIAHTGSARALLFRPGAVPDAAAACLRNAGFGGIVKFRVGEQA